MKKNKILGKNNLSYSLYPKSAIIKKKILVVFEKIIGLLFFKIDFDEESLSTLNEYSDKGVHVYASYQTRNFSLFIFKNKLKSNGFKLPVLAIGFTNFFINFIVIFYKKVVLFIISIVKKEKRSQITDKEFIKEIINNDESITISFYSKRLFLKRYIERKSDSIKQLLEIQQEMELPIFIFPQILFWNRNPERSKSFISSKAVGDRRFFSALFTIYKSITPPFIRVSHPINLKEEIENNSGKDLDSIAQSVRSKLLEVYESEKRATLGPVIKSQREMMDKVLNHENIISQIDNLTIKDKKSEKYLRKKAYLYYKEIAADFSIVIIKYFSMILRAFVFKKLFTELHYDIEDIKEIRKLSQKSTLVILPSHKSHMDYLIISSLFYENKLFPPHIVAGSNLLFFPMGYIFRKSGAFFIKRSFKGKDLYVEVLKQYTKTLVSEKYMIEFFIEGGRSRTGAVGTPKMGYLKYLIEAIDEGYGEDIMFLPAAVNYDRIVEEESYSKELKGKNKKSESSSGLFKSLKFLKRNHGRAYLSFDKPISLNEFRESLNDEENLINEIGQHVIKKINSIIMVSPFAMISTSMLLSSGKGFTRSMLDENVKLLYNYFKYCNTKMSDVLDSEEGFTKEIDTVLDAYEEDEIITKIKLKGSKFENNSINEEMYILNENERQRINFYKNTVVHYLYSISFISIVLLKFNKNNILISDIKILYSEIVDLFNGEFVFPDSMDDVDSSIDSVLEYLKIRSIISITENNISIIDSHRKELEFYSKTIQDVFESYIVTFNALSADDTNSFIKKELIQLLYQKGMQAYLLEEIKLSESLSHQYFNNALKFLQRKNAISEKIISKNKSQIEILNFDYIKSSRDMIIDLLSKK